MQLEGKTIEGKRKWDPDGEVSLYKHLLGVIRSDISHSLESVENKKTSYIESLKNSSENELFIRDNNYYESTEYLIIEEELISGIYFELEKKDSDLADVFLCTIMGLQPDEISIKISKSIKEVYTIKKRLGRNIKIMEENDFKKIPRKSISDLFDHYSAFKAKNI